MRALVVAIVAVSLTGCSTLFGSGSNGPGKLPQDANGVIWSGKPTEQVASCLQQKGVSTAYQARAVTEKGVAYPTVIVIVPTAGQSESDSRVFDCV